MPNFAQQLDANIWDFVHRAENRCLALGTDASSTHFRGSIFGQVDARPIAANLQGDAARRVSVLWLGSNPNVPESIDGIVAGVDDNALAGLAQFRRQMESSSLGHQVLDGGATESWDPIGRPVGHWRFYRDVFATMGVLDDVAFANYYPWGSRNMGSFWQQIRRVEKTQPLYVGLEGRIRAFSDQQNALIVDALRPRLIVAPFSLRDGPNGLGQASSSDEKLPITRSKRTFDLVTRRVGRGASAVRVAFLPHPSALSRYGGAGTSFDQLRDALGGLLSREDA